MEVKFCPKCGESVPENANFCSSCGTNLSTIISKSTETVAISSPITKPRTKPTNNTSELKENAERKNILNNAITDYIQQGYRVSSQTENAAQLIKPKQFSLLLAIILFLFYIIPFFLYLLYYLAQKDKTIYIAVNEQGEISVTDEKGQQQFININKEKQPAPIVNKTVPSVNDPGYTKSTKVMLAILACGFLLCILTVILWPATPAHDTGVGQAWATSLATQTEKSAEVATTAPTSIPVSIATPTKVATFAPTKTTTPTEQIETLVDVYSILGKPVNEVEAIIGSTVLITPNDDNDDNLAGGEYRDYKIGKYGAFVAYDKNGVARVFQVMDSFADVYDGLSKANYSLTQWKQILPQFGVYINTPPDRTAPMAIYWDNYNGYFIAVAGDPVYTIQIAEFGYGMDQ